MKNKDIDWSRVFLIQEELPPDPEYDAMMAEEDASYAKRLDPNYKPLPEIHWVAPF